MGYRISYTTGKAQKKMYNNITISPFAAVAILVGVICIICIIVFSPDLEHTFHMLFPWTEPATKEAFIKMEESIQFGMPLTKAVSAFCKELITGVAD